MESNISISSECRLHQGSFHFNEDQTQKLKTKYLEGYLSTAEKNVEDEEGRWFPTQLPYPPQAHDISNRTIINTITGSPNAGKEIMWLTKNHMTISDGEKQSSIKK